MLHGFVHLCIHLLIIYEYYVKMHICIPSYQRAETCQAKTLSMLHKANVPSKNIIVFVANHDEYKIYKDTLNPLFYGDLRIGKKGLVQQRDFIMKSFPVGEQLVFMDDDVESIDFSLSSRYQNNTLMHFIKDAFQQCKKYGCHICLIYIIFQRTLPFQCFSESGGPSFGVET